MMYILGVLILAAAYLVWNHVSWKALPWPESALRLPTYQAHRGYWVGGARENTLEAFIEAKKQGFEMCELDVHITADGVPVVFHDDSLNRMAGVVGNIAEMTYERIRSAYPIPTLHEVLSSPDVPQYFNVELKTRQKINSDLEKTVVDVIKETHSEKRILFSSFNPMSLYRLKKLLPNVPRALLATHERASENSFLLRNRCLAPYIGVHLLHLDYRYVTAKQVIAYKKRGVPVVLWTVNDAESAAEYLKAGAVSIITDSLKKEKPR